MLTSLVASSCLVSLSRAFTNIEDFTVGSFSQTIGFQRQFSFKQTGMDKSHSAFGERSGSGAIISNPDNALLHFDVGNHEQKLWTSSDRLSYNLFMTLGAMGNVEIDLSQETSIYFDLYTDPSNFSADTWQLYINDSSGNYAFSQQWQYRPGGIEFKRDSFSRSIDWARVVSIQFTENMSAAPNPLVYSVQHIYAVPELPPSLFLLATLGFVRRRNSARAQ
ncbi:MAG: hypothetical protein JNM34_12800 [Chthonomonadaceae bacterium]|nr:hypothetical protein [Chthonomonadaceae bacterium]